MKIEQTISALVSLAKNLNKHKIRWALGASLMLYLEGYDTTVDDIDIIVHTDDYVSLLYMLENYDYVYQDVNQKYKTKHFFSLQSDGIDVDIMLDFKVISGTTTYEFPFHINTEILIDDTPIYLTSVEEWLIAYKTMNRIDKVELIQSNRKRNLQ